MSAPVELKAFLDALGTVGALSVGSMPASPDVMGAIYEYGGLAPEGAFGVAGIDVENQACQLVFRGAPDDYAGPRSRADIAWRALAAVQPGALSPGAVVYRRIWPQQSPFLFNRDDNRRVSIAFNVYIAKNLS